MSAPGYTEAEVLAEFADALRAAGFRLRGAPAMDGEWHHAAVEGDKGAKRSGSYRGHFGGIRPAGFICNHKDPTRSGSWKSGATLPSMTAAERETARRKQAEDATRRERQHAARQAAVAARVEAEWRRAAPAPADHPYLRDKGVQPHGLRQDRSGRLLVPVRDADGKLWACQTIAPNGKKLFPKDGRKAGCFYVLGTPDPAQPVAFGEGFATTASVHEATGLACVVALDVDNKAKVMTAWRRRHPDQPLIDAADNDHLKPANAGRDMAERLAREIGAVPVLPPFLPEQVGTDWNDYAALHSLDAVRVAIAAALPPAAPRLRPFHPLPQHSAAQARATVAELVVGFMGRVQAWHATPEDARDAPEHAGLAVEVAVGKTSIACGELPGFIAAAKAAGRPHRILFTVPTHKLGGEVNARLAGLGLHVATWRGREAEDPETGTAMCHDLPAVRDAIAAFQVVEATVCGKPGGTRCPFAGRCSYQLQKPAAAAADVVVAAHEAMLGTLPAGIGEGFALTIADEGWLQDGVETGRALTVETLRAGEIEHPVPYQGDPARRDDEATIDLHVLRRLLADAADASPDGYLTRAALTGAGLSAADCTRANKLEWRRKVAGVMRPGMAAEARQKAVRRCAGNAAIPRLSALWTAAGALLDGDEEATGRVEFARRDTAEGSQRVVLLHTLRPVAERVLALPLLLPDATLPATLLRHRLPRLVMLAEVRAVAPHMRVHQVLGGFGKTSIVPNPNPENCANPGKREKENQRRHNLIANVRDFVLLRTSGARALVVTYKELEPFFANLPGVETAHFGAVEGLDHWGPQPGRPGVRHLFQIGRPLASLEDTRRPAAALTSRPVPKENPGLVTRGATMRDGSAAPVEVRTYADPDLEAVRASITDAATLQVIGRGRGLNRTAANPLDVWLLAGDVVAPLPLDTLTRWEDVTPGLSERMAARGVVLCSPSDAARAYPDIFLKGESAAKKAMQREKVDQEHGDIPLWRTLVGDCPRVRLVRVEYRPKLPKAKTRIAWVLPDRLPQLRAWLQGKVGVEIAFYKPAEQPQQREEAPAMPPLSPAPIPSPALRVERLMAQGVG